MKMRSNNYFNQTSSLSSTTTVNKLSLNIVKRNNITAIVISDAATIPFQGFGRFPIPEVNNIATAVEIYNNAIKNIFNF